ncbi:hypothetical protein THIOM_003495 [Candidatus Thiomargarita nelsonii]|uniref:Uncharacterized protein n=1 Tax=Candidatus Thiomargarita nelsonii TaxID=1003181 RepID=A0A176RYB7_9GAMM|nr:hypothetical protein THIOM_003495 [Candidatus Thiomargarita nelsonii]
MILIVRLSLVISSQLAQPRKNFLCQIFEFFFLLITWIARSICVHKNSCQEAFYFELFF